jgi:DnaK suppressor protein
MAANGLDEAFIREQKARLEELKQELNRMRSGMEQDEQERAEELQDETPDSGDQSQNIFAREMDATIEGQAQRRLEDVERALQKIEEGTYGLSDESGEEIPRGRLEAAPEAIRTVEEQQRLERERRPI